MASKVYQEPDTWPNMSQVLLDAVPSSVLLIGRDLRILLANRNFLEKSRHSEEDTLNRPLHEVLPPSILDNLDLTHRIQHVLRWNEPTAGERMTYRPHGGLVRTYYYRIVPFARRQPADSALLLMDDVTEQARLSQDIRRMERHLAVVVESISDILLSTDPEGRILSWNRSAETASGYHSSEVAQRLFHELLLSEHRADLKQVLSQLNHGTPSLNAQWNLVTKAGAPVLISWTCSPMLWDGNTIGMWPRVET